VLLGLLSDVIPLRHAEGMSFTPLGLKQAASDQEGTFDWGQVMGDT